MIYFFCVKIENIGPRFYNSIQARKDSENRATNWVKYTCTYEQIPI